MDKEIEYIRMRLSDSELLVCIAEEAAELTQAALKLRRTMIKGNPTPVRSDDAYKNLVEEMTDVVLCAKALHLRVDKRLMAEKLERWERRLNGD